MTLAGHCHHDDYHICFHRPQSLLAGMNRFLALLEITFRRDPKNFRPRINKLHSIKVRTDCLSQEIQQKTINFLLSVPGHGTEEEWELFLPGRLKTNPLQDQVDLHEENLCRPIICLKYSRAAFRERRLKII